MKIRALLIAVLLLALVAGTFTTGVLVGNLFPLFNGQGQSFLTFNREADNRPGLNTTEATDLASQAGTPAELQGLFSPFWEAWGIVHEEFVDQPVDDTALMQGAIDGMLESLDDPYTNYLPPEEYFQFETQLDGHYEGIGAWVDTTTEYLTIISPMPGSPAEEAGLKSGDEIHAVDGEDMTGLDGSVVISKVVGPEGSTVMLTVRREGVAELLTFEVVRANISIPSVRSEMLEGRVAYVQLFQFAGDSRGQLRDALEELLDQNPVGLILDLRNNGGGLLTSAIDITSEFIADGVLMHEVFGDGTRETYRARRGGLATEIPLVVLVNEGSASASEILAGAIQDYERGTLVGTTTFGKGSVQLPVRLNNDEGAVRVTIARWLTPNERQISEIGIEPDIVVPIEEADVEAEGDPQLEKALQILLEAS